MAKYPLTVATLPALTNRSTYGTILANKWLEEFRALQADYASSVYQFSSLASLFAVSRDNMGALKENSVSHGALTGVTASQHHIKIHASLHINTPSDRIPNELALSDIDSVYHKGAMSPDQVVKLNGVVTNASHNYSDNVTYEKSPSIPNPLPVYVDFAAAAAGEGYGVFVRSIGNNQKAYMAMVHSPTQQIEEGELNHSWAHWGVSGQGEDQSTMDKVSFNTLGGFNHWIDQEVEHSAYWRGVKDNPPKLGVSQTWLDMQDQYRANAANNTIHDITTGDIGISAWVKIPADATNGFHAILAKRENNTQAGYWLYTHQPHYPGVNIGIVEDDAAHDEYRIEGTISIIDGNWHHIAAIIDRDNPLNCSVWVDGVQDLTAVKTGTLGDVGSITTSRKLWLGYSSFGDAYYFDGQVREVVLAYPADIMAAGEMGAEGEIAKLARSYFNPQAYCSREDYWACNDGSGTTITGENNNLTLNSANAWILR